MVKTKVVVVGLGYVGLPLAIALARKYSVAGLDIDTKRIAELQAGYDRTREIDDLDLKTSSLTLTSLPEDCVGAEFYIVTVPTPVDEQNRPDLRPLIAASRTVASMLDGSVAPVIVFESTVYPGVTEEVCGPTVAGAAGLSQGKDFFLGYSPERINPGDREHRIDTIVKVVAGENELVTARLAALYGSITSAGVFQARSIKAAEAAKVIENAQRDINIAFMNEITQIFSKLDLSVWDVLDAARTKWNFLPFQPGLVGGHCIGVDPYYLSHCAQMLGHAPDVILAGRATNDSMGRWIADRLHALGGARPGKALIMGLTFKENVPDLRNSRVVDLIRRLDELGHEVSVHDPLADPQESLHEYGIALDSDALDYRYDLVVGAVAHDDYRVLSAERLRVLTGDEGYLADLKGIWRDRFKAADPRYWTL